MKKIWKAIFLILVLFLSLSALIFGLKENDTDKNVPRSTEGNLKKVIIDTDGGPDDAWALTLLILAEESIPDLEVVAITCTYGNTILKHVERNVLLTLTVLNRTDIPVYSGAESSLIPVPDYIDSRYFGEDGFGDANFSIPIKGSIQRSKHAAIAILDLVYKFKDELSIVCLGPLTNMATVVALDKKAFSYLDKFVVMGGSVGSVGNILPNVEYNFYQDPWANFIVLNSSSKPLMLLPWETNSRMSLPMDWRVNELGKINIPVVEMLNKAERSSLEKSTTWEPSDLVTVAAAIHESLIKKYTVINVTPVYDGMARGSCLVDYGNLTGKPANAMIIQDLDVQKFKQIVLDTLS